ncbi:hypothetical protein HMPREF1557_01621 [Streptococcus sobrinus W1703]|uniref:Uncharacterized protein n=1 Tax=Streptococcus sobrinus W1703 TaxID=1227275 RepID=U2KB79_9STRE|nr:hypothetical protein HMPREF1557_01621 [Streptococcus sobrinus W1703]
MKTAQGESESLVEKSFTDGMRGGNIFNKLSPSKRILKIEGAWTHSIFT